MYLDKLSGVDNYYEMNIPKGYEVKDDKRLDKDEEIQSPGCQLNVGEKEKELERLGLVDDADGIVLRKENTKEEESDVDKCETCANRKYQDGSDEMVSFKSASHISPEAAATRVRAHEQEHVSNAYKKAEQKDAKVVQASVAIHTSICPECGRTYVSGGTTTTTIRYNQDEYADNAKKQDATVLPGANIDTVL
jgi:hypothetical protein